MSFQDSKIAMARQQDDKTTGLQDYGTTGWMRHELIKGKHINGEIVP